MLEFLGRYPVLAKNFCFWIHHTQNQHNNHIRAVFFNFFKGSNALNLLVLGSLHERADCSLPRHEARVWFSNTSRGRAHLLRLKAAILLCPQLLPNYRSGAGKDYT